MKTELEQYKKIVAERLASLSPFLQNYAMGDFSEGIDIPEEEDEFTELLVGLSLMVDDFREMIREREETISKLKQTEAALAEEHALLRTLIENMPDPIYVKDVESQFLLVNRGVSILMGCSPDEAIGKTDLDFYPRELAAEFFADEQAIIESGQALIGKEERVVDSAGNATWQSTNKVPFYDSSGNIKGIVGIGRDITQRKIQEEALIASEERMRTIIDTNKDAMIVIDHQGLITLFNPAAENIFVRSAKDMFGQSINALMPDSYRSQHTQDVSSYFKTGKPDGAIGKTLEVPAVRSNGEEFPIEISLARGGHGDRAFVLGVIRDISERKQAEQTLLEHAEQLEQTNKQLETFNRMAVGREHRMIELKREINKLSEELGNPAPYDISFAN